jgi:hypothetical protein
LDIISFFFVEFEHKLKTSLVPSAVSQTRYCHAPQLWLDELLPRVAVAAESNPNRASRVAACELLHGLTLWMVGESCSHA